MDRRMPGRDYEANFDPEVYLKIYYSEVAAPSPQGNLIGHMMTCLHEAFSSGAIRGKRLLDIGSGPSVHSIISATPYCDTIFLSDFTAQNRKSLKQWLDGELHHSFHNFIAFVLALENNGEITAEREKSMKDKVSGIFPLDLYQDKPLQEVILSEVDIVTSTLCLEVVTRDLAEYEAIARRISKMVKIHGHVVLYGVLGQSFYSVGNVRFSCHRMYAGEVKQSWEKCGFRIINWKENVIDENAQSISDFETVFMMIAQKCSK